MAPDWSDQAWSVEVPLTTTSPALALLTYVTPEGMAAAAPAIGIRLMAKKTASAAALHHILDQPTDEIRKKRPGRHPWRDCRLFTAGQWPGHINTPQLLLMVKLLIRS
jgi:hypothetical protein